MELKIYSYYIIERKTYEYCEHVDDLDRKLLSICQPISITNVFSRYYPFGDAYMLGDEFPYILRDGVYVWGVQMKSVTIREFLDTFPECAEDGIYVETGFPAAGGRDYIFGKKAWDLMLFLVSRQHPEIGFTVELISKLRGLLEACDGSDIQGKTEPHIILALASNYFGAFRGKEFSPREVAELLNIEEYRAIKILLSLGFKKKHDTDKYILLEDEREKVWELALKVASFDYDYAEKINSGSTEYLINEESFES